MLNDKMAFILRKDNNQGSAEAFIQSWHRYRDYLASIADKLPDSAREFALADWHHDFDDHRAPHDAWVEAVHIFETALGERQEQRQIHIKVRLLGAYHDGHIEIEYMYVRRYSINSIYPNHGDWGYDEIRLSDDGHVLHEIEFEMGDTAWLIECENIRYTWLPGKALDESTQT